MHFIFFSAITVRADREEKVVVTVSFDCKTVAANPVSAIYSVFHSFRYCSMSYSVLNVLNFLLLGECSCSIANSV